MSTIEPFNLFAVRYAHHAKRSSAENFIGGDPHEEGSPLDYFVWVAQRSDRVFVVDTGFGEEAARLRQRQLLRENIPNGQRLWSAGLQPAHVVTPDSERMHMQFYESEAYYWLGVKRLAEMLTLINPKEGARMAREAEAYRKDLLAAVERSITLTPVVPVRDGTYRSFIPFAPYVRGFAAGAWGWRRCQGHVGAIY